MPPFPFLTRKFRQKITPFPPPLSHTLLLSKIISRCALIFSGLFIISLGTFSILILPWIDTTEYNDNAVSVAMKGDSYYHLLVPLTIPVTIIVVRIYVSVKFTFIYKIICLPLYIEGHLLLLLTIFLCVFLLCR